MAEPLRLGIVGAGENTRAKHIPGLLAIEGVELVGVCNRTTESSTRIAQQFGIPRVYTNWREVVLDSSLDAVVIGTWPNMHSVVTVAALEAGKHVLCEARMARDASEAHAMLRAARARPHLISQLVPPQPTLRVDPTVRRLVDEGYLGEVLALDVRAGGSFIDREASVTWRQDVELSGFNTMTLGMWYESVMRWVGEARRVVSMGQVFVKSRRDATGTLRAVHVPDHVDVVADMVCGAQAHFQISAVAALGRPPEAFLYGSDGTLRVCAGRLYGGRRGDNDLNEVEILPEEEGGWRVEEEFVNAVRGEEQIRLTTFEDGVRYMEFTEAVARSMMTGAAVPLPLLK
jgi:predicted dehydrogenase